MHQPATTAKRRLSKVAWFVLLYLAGVGGLSLLAWLLKTLMADL